jgi:hypothetical protein
MDGAELVGLAQIGEAEDEAVHQGSGELLG